MTILKKYNSIDQTKIPKDISDILKGMKDKSKNFTLESYNEIFEPQIDNIIIGLKEKHPKSIKGNEAKSKISPTKSFPKVIYIFSDLESEDVNNHILRLTEELKKYKKDNPKANLVIVEDDYIEPVKVPESKPDKENKYDFIYEVSNTGNYRIKTFLTLPTNRGVKFIEDSDNIKGLKYYKATENGLKYLKETLPNNAYGDKQRLSSKDLVNSNYEKGGELAVYLEYFDTTPNGIPFEEYITSSQGAEFILFTEGFNKTQIADAKRWIKAQRDALKVKVASKMDYTEAYRSHIYRHPKTKPLKWYQIQDDIDNMEKEQKKGTSVDKYVETFILPNVEQTEKDNISNYGESICKMEYGGDIQDLSIANSELFESGGEVEKLESEKLKLRDKVDKLRKLHKEKFGNPDIESPMSKEEKASKAEIAKVYSEINQIVKRKNQLVKSKMQYGGDIQDLSIANSNLFERGGITYDEYTRLLDKYEQLGEFYMDAHEEGNADEMNRLNKEIQETESKIHKYERDYAKGGKTDEKWAQKAEDEMERKGTVGAFTKKAKKAKMSTTKFAKKVLSNPEEFDETTRKQAQFMKNLNPEKFEKRKTFMNIVKERQKPNEDWKDAIKRVKQEIADEKK